MRISLVIPAYNEENRLPPFLASIVGYLHQQPNALHEIIVVDDGSSDATYQHAKSWQAKLPHLKVIQQSRNQGKGKAVQTGVLAATGEAVVFIDADGATAITELPKMRAALTEAQIGIGNRWMAGAVTRRHSALRQLSGWANRLYMSLFGLGNIDTMCGFKVYHRAVARQLFAHLLEDRWLFDTEIAYKATRQGYSIKNFPIIWESKDGSKLGAGTLIKAGVRIWPLIRQVNRQLRRSKVAV